MRMGHDGQNTYGNAADYPHKHAPCSRCGIEMGDHGYRCGERISEICRVPSDVEPRKEGEMPRVIDRDKILIAIGFLSRTRGNLSIAISDLMADHKEQARRLEATERLINDLLLALRTAENAMGKAIQGDKYKNRLILALECVSQAIVNGTLAITPKPKPERDSSD